MEDEDGNTVRRVGQGRRASNIDQLIAHLVEDPESAVVWNGSQVWLGSLPIRLIEGRIEGPDRGGAMTTEVFANIFVLDLARTLGLDMLVPAGMHFRWFKNPEEPALIRARTIRPSYNGRAGRWERGLAVAEGPWLYGLKNDYKWCYFVSGYEVGRGSDDEPILNVNTLELAGGIMERQQVFEEFYARNKDKLSLIHQETGVEVAELYALLMGF